MQSGHIEVINGEEVVLAENEQKEVFECPECGSDLITNYGPGISVTFCLFCGYSEEDYDF